MMRRLLHTSWILVLALALLAAGAIYYAGWTEAGLQRLASLASRRLGPVTLTIAGARGTLHGGLHADRVEVDHQRVRVVVTGVDGRIALLPLLWQTIRVSQLDLADVRVEVLPHTGPPSEPWEPHFLAGLLDIEVARLNVGHAAVVAPGGTTLEATQLSVAAQLGAKEIRVFESTLHYSGFELRTAGTLHATAALRMRAQVRASSEPALQPAWLADGQIDGDLDRLGISAHVLAPFSASFRGSASTLSGNWHWQGESQLLRFELQPWGAGNALGVVSGQLQLSGDHRGFAARGELTPSGLRSGPLAVDFAGNYAAHQLDIERLLLRQRAYGVQVSAAGSVAIVEGGPRLELAGRWQSFRWPLAEAAPLVRSDAGSYTLAGLKPYAFTAEGDLLPEAGPALQFQADGRLAHDGLEIPVAAVTAYGGRAQLHGEVRWSPQVTWTVGGTMHGLDVAHLRPGINGHLNFTLAAEGHNEGARHPLQVRVSEISGNVRGRSASGHAGIALSGEDWLLQDVRLQLGATRIEADGHLGAHPDLRFALDTPDLALVQEGASGRVRAEGQIGGDELNPMLRAHVSGSELAYGTSSLHALEASVDFDPGGSGHATTSLDLAGLRLADHGFDHLRFSTTGTAAAHRFTLELGAAPLLLRAGGTASFASGVWHAQFGEFNASDGAEMNLQLAAPAAMLVALDGEQLRLERLCLHDSTAAFCAEAEHASGRSAFELSAARVPLRALTAGLSTDTTFDGQVSLDLRAQAPANGPWGAAFIGALADASVRHRLESGRVESFNLGNGDVQLTLDAAGLVGSVGLDAGAAGNIVGKAQARGPGSISGNWPLQGELKLETHSLGFIDSYVAQVDRVSGQLNANLTLGGTLGAPQLNGELRLSNAEVDAYQVNLALRELNFVARLNGPVLQLDGSARAGADGHGRLSGQLTWRESLPYGQLHLTGENLRIINLPEARVQASPDVTMKLNGHRIDITGTVTLPYGRLLRPDQLANAARTSSDEVIVSPNQASAKDGFHVFSDLTLLLGERVTINTFGLAGRLSGSLRVVADDTGFNRGTGGLKVEEGKYTAYGRQLDIELGRLQFRNGPLNDPAIDLRAIKQFPDIKAGVNVRGTLRQPRLTFFSDPPVSQSQIVSLLLAGGSLDSVQNSGDSKQSKDLALMQGSAMLFQQFGSKVGLSDVGVESDPNSNDTSLVLGRYLSPRLYVSYGVSLAEAINTFKMRYTIGNSWTIKTEAGYARSADLVYTIER
jgi:translocation and assembly module TamB